MQIHLSSLSLCRLPSHSGVSTEWLQQQLPSLLLEAPQPSLDTHVAAATASASTICGSGAWKVPSVTMTGATNHGSAEAARESAIASALLGGGTPSTLTSIASTLQSQGLSLELSPEVESLLSAGATPVHSPVSGVVGATLVQVRRTTMATCLHVPFGVLPCIVCDRVWVGVGS